MTRPGIRIGVRSPGSKVNEVEASRTVRDSATTRGRVGYGLPLLIVAAIVLIAAAVWFVSGSDTSARGESRQTLHSRKAVVRKQKPKKERKLLRLKTPKKARKIVGLGKVKPDFLDNPEEIAKLTEEMKKMFLELQNALDLDDRKKVYALVHKLQLMDEWPDGIPKSVKLKALRALSWFGAEGIAEAIRFLEDSDQEVAKSALETFESQLNDSWSLGDRALAQTLVNVSKINMPQFDSNELSEFYNSIYTGAFSSMRDTVKAQTILDILNTGSPKAVEVLEKNWDALLDVDADAIDTTKSIAKQVEKVLADAEKAYKDDPQKAKDDEEMYGKTNWDW